MKTIQVTDDEPEEKHGRELYVDRLVRRDGAKGNEGGPPTAKELGLHGYDAFRHNLVTASRRARTAGKEGR